MVDKEKTKIINDLTLREIEVLNLIAKGLSNKDIVEKLCISMFTVKSHIVNIDYKLRMNKTKDNPNSVSRVKKALFYIENREEILEHYNCLKQVEREKSERCKLQRLQRKIREGQHERKR